MLVARNLEYRYGDRTVLAVDALDLPRGTVTGFVGPNGSGKSTLLRVLAFVDTPTGGALQLDGKAIATRGQRTAARRRVTLVEQHPLLFDTTVAANLRYPLRVRRVPRAESDRRIAAAMERAGVTHLIDRPARQLSVGETQRVAVARALALAPDVLLLDEPLSAADRDAVARMPALLEELSAAGVTIGLSTHGIESAYRLAPRIVGLANGRLCPVTPENLFRVDVPAGDGPRLVRAGPLELLVVTDMHGPATLAIPSADIVVSVEPLRSSARNQFRGTIVGIGDDGRGGVALTVDVGTELVARITPGALADLGLALGSPVVLSVKAVAVQVF